MSSTRERDRFGLMMRNSFISNIQKQLRAGIDGKACILSISVEHMKLLINWFGQRTGDRVLRHIASVLLEWEEEEGCLAGRFGSDDFFLFMPTAEKAQILQVYENICIALDQECPQADFRPVIGVCVIEEGETDVTMSCNNAQIAADTARGRAEDRIRLFNPTMMYSFRRKQQMAAERNKALLQDNGDYVGADLRDIQTECDALSILGESALVIAGLNLNTGELRIAKADVPFPSVIHHATTHFSMFNNLIVAQNLIHPDDRAEYLRLTALSHLREQFFGGQKQMYLSYRQKKDDGKFYKVGLMIAAGRVCDPEHARIALVLRDAASEASEESMHRIALYHSDPLTGLFNRTRFERDLERYSEKPPENLLCVYIDAVGLHEINNHLGHKAGDSMLCTVAGASRSVFQQDTIYRIGGDEFVILSKTMSFKDGWAAAKKLRAILREANYEISIGLHQLEKGEFIGDAVDHAENAMRRDKRAYYERTGNLEQMRMLNEQLERILVEKQDTDQFLRAIALHYKGVYIVNMKTGRMRCIFTPENFKKMEENANGMFFVALKQYERELVKEDWCGEFDKLFDFEDVNQHILEDGILCLTYQKKDDTWVRLQVMKYMEDESNGENTDLMMWIFANAAPAESELDSGYVSEIKWQS